MTSIGEIEKVLRSAIGMDIQSVGTTSIDRAVAKRLRVTGIGSYDEYLLRLSADDREVQELIECVVVPETWFFRGPETFSAMVAIARGLCDQTGPGRPLRILSVPSSTGEEPYSIAMALLDGGFNPHEFSIEAVDVSISALERAGAARYGANSFRSSDLSFRERYFTKSGAAWQLSGIVTERVRFKRRNVVATDFLADTAPFHIVFCRNLLIYLDRDTQSRLVDRLSELMIPPGYLFLGSGEAIAISEKPFANAGYPMAFAYEKRAQAMPEKKNLRRVGRSLRSGIEPERGSGRISRRTKQDAGTPATSVKKTKRKTSSPATSAELEAGNAESPRQPLLAQARGYADAGRLTEAASVCERLLADGDASADTLYLLGVVRDALGEIAQAAECYRRAIYLDPRHTDAMLHLALIREKQGDATAANLRARARRIGAGEAPAL